MNNDRYNRQTAFFGNEGQAKLKNMTVAIVGVGGLGTHVIQQLAYLGIVKFILIDRECLDETNLNRYIGAKPQDVGEKKVDIAQRLILRINPDASVRIIPHPLKSKQAFIGIINSDCTFGCLDNEGARLILNELCLAYDIPYFDLATEIFPQKTDSYGGRISISLDSAGCIVCHGHLDLEEAGQDLENPDARKDRENIYGISKNDLDGIGPSVVSINGVVASLGVTEFLVWATGLRKPNRNIFYRGKQSIVTLNNERQNSDCYYCYGVRGKQTDSGVNRYISDD